MKRVYFKFLFIRHKVLFALGLKQTKIIKIWFNEDIGDTCAFVNARSGIYHIPITRMTDNENITYSDWLANITMTEKYGLHDKHKNKTIYTLTGVIKKIRDEKTITNDNA